MTYTGPLHHALSSCDERKLRDWLARELADEPGEPVPGEDTVVSHGEPVRTLVLGGAGRTSYQETGPCDGPTGQHEFAVGRALCVFCDRACQLPGR